MIAFRLRCVRVQHSEQLLLGIPRLESVMFRIKFTYLKITDARYFF